MNNNIQWLYYCEYELSYNMTGHHFKIVFDICQKVACLIKRMLNDRVIITVQEPGHFCRRRLFYTVFGDFYFCF